MRKRVEYRWHCVPTRAKSGAVPGCDRGPSFSVRARRYGGETMHRISAAPDPGNGLRTGRRSSEARRRIRTGFDHHRFHRPAGAGRLPVPPAPGAADDHDSRSAVPAHRVRAYQAEVPVWAVATAAGRTPHARYSLGRRAFGYHGSDAITVAFVSGHVYRRQVVRRPARDKGTRCAARRRLQAPAVVGFPRSSSQPGLMPARPRPLVSSLRL